MRRIHRGRLCSGANSIAPAGPVRAFAVAIRLSRNTQRPVKNGQDQHHLQDRHCALPSVLLPGMLRSEMRNSGTSRRISANAARLPEAERAVYSFSVRTCVSNIRIESASSTMRRFALAQGIGDLTKGMKMGTKASFPCKESQICSILYRACGETVAGLELVRQERPYTGTGSPHDTALRFSGPFPVEKLHQISHANGLRLGYCVLPFALAVACAGVFLSRRVMASAALNGNWRTDCSPVVLRTTSTRRF